jgi:hypothetical protein
MIEKIPEWVNIPKINTFSELLKIAQNYNDNLEVSIVYVKSPSPEPEITTTTVFYAYYVNKNFGSKRPIAVSENAYYKIDKMYPDYARYVGETLCFCGKGNLTFWEYHYQQVKCTHCGFQFRDNMLDAYGDYSVFI